MIPNPSRRAFTLMEMLIVISIVAIAIIIEGRLYQDTMQAIRSSNAAENQINRLSRMSSALRQDVWSAASVETPDSRTIVLTRPDGAASRWQLGDAEVIRATGPGDAPIQQKWDVLLPLHARRHGATIVLYTVSKQGSTGAEMRFVSQVMLGRGNR